MANPTQEFLDRFYWQNGSCCAGCDWWHSISPKKGECHRAPIVSGNDRMLAMDITSCSLPFGSGHPITDLDHVCGEFKDEFDWSSLPPSYRSSVGARI